MSVYSYTFRRKKYFYFKVRFKNKQYSRRLDEHGDRYETVREAMFAESSFVKSLDIKVKRNKVYIYQLFDDFSSYLSRFYKITTVYHILGSYKLHIFPLVKDLCVKDFNQSVVDSLNDYIQLLNIKSKNHIIAAARNLVKFLASYGVNLRSDSIERGGSFNLSSSKITKFWTFEEFQKFIAVVDNFFYKLLFSVLYFYGLRISELRGIRKECFNQYNLIINQCVTNHGNNYGQVVITPKTNSSFRSFPMFPFIFELYLAIKENSSDYVFSSRQDCLTIGISSIRWNLKKYCKKSGVKLIKLHEFRHSCASLLINQGMDSLQVAKWLGHSNPAITLSIYSHLFDNRSNEVFDLLNSYGTKKNTFLKSAPLDDKKI